ncbi:MAG: alpha/beta hydrolase family protein [Terracidiphilus sp.]
MIGEWYARSMFKWETRLTTRDENRVVRPLEWGFDWIAPFLEQHGLASALPDSQAAGNDAEAEAAIARINRLLIERSGEFFGYRRPTDFRLELRHPQLYPTNVRPETLAHAAALLRQAAEGVLQPAQFLRFTSPEHTPYPANDQVNARWFPAPAHKDPARPKQAIVVLPQWNADGFSHNALCSLFNRMGVSALRLSMPYHDIRRPEEIERSDYSVSANIGRTLSACRQAVVDIRCCIDWLEEQGYQHFGVLGTSLGSCYAFLASAHDARIRVNAFNHASTAFGDVVWAGQSTRHIRQAVEQAGFTQERLCAMWAAISPVNYYAKFAGVEVAGPSKRVLLVYARYDLTFPREYSLQVVEAFRHHGVRFEPHVLPCGHYTTGETPYKYLDGWHMGWFVYRAFKALRREKAAALLTAAASAGEAEREAISR